MADPSVIAKLKTIGVKEDPLSDESVGEGPGSEKGKVDGPESSTETTESIVAESEMKQANKKGVSVKQRVRNRPRSSREGWAGIGREIMDAAIGEPKQANSAWTRWLEQTHKTPLSVAVPIELKSEFMDRLHEINKELGLHGSEQIKMTDVLTTFLDAFLYEPEFDIGVLGLNEKFINATEEEAEQS